MTLCLPPPLPPSPPQALQEKVESLQRRLHASEKKLFSKELEGEEKVTQPARAEAAPSETHFLFFIFFFFPLPRHRCRRQPSHCSNLHTSRAIYNFHSLVGCGLRGCSPPEQGPGGGPSPPSAAPQNQNLVSVQTTTAGAARWLCRKSPNTTEWTSLHRKTLGRRCVCVCGADAQP